MDLSSIELDYLEGTVSSVVFYNEENGYSVLRVAAGGEDEVTVVGSLPGVAPGEGIFVHGTWEQHSSYGPQFKAEMMDRQMPSSAEDVYLYLASGTIKGIGAVTARRLVDSFGADVLTVMAEQPERLTSVQGITHKRALSMGESLRQQLSMRFLLDFLTSHELPLHTAIPLYRRFGNNALPSIQENPYLLTDDLVGAPFHIADHLALSLGLSEENPLRLEAGLLFELTHNLENGHVFLPRNKLLAATVQLLDCDEALLAESLHTLEARKDIISAPIAKEDACYLPRLYQCECYVANVLTEMAKQEYLPPPDLENLLHQIQHEQGISYAPMQSQAVHTAACRQVMLLTGGPGTGKTTSLRAVLALFEHLGLKTALAAPTGRAAKRLSETCQAEASTIHRLLETCYDPQKGSLVFAHHEEDPLDVEAVIVDETSMVDIPLMCALLSALPNDCRLILVGDPNQLPSVGPGNLLSDLLRAGTLPSVHLSEIFRQAASSAIIRNAHMVNHGEPPELRNNATEDFFFLRRPEPSGALDTIVDLCRSRLPEKMGIPSDQIQVLSPTRRGMAGTVSLNQALQNAVNPPDAQKAERSFGSQIFRSGDRVMQIRNNYDLMWQSRNGSDCGMGIFNGDIGHIESIDPKSNILTIDFDGHLAEYTPDLWNQLEPAYAITVHKSQGSEYQAVILCAVQASPMLLTRSVLYTAMTRAKDLLILVGDDSVVSYMASNDRPTRRYSGLRARLVRAAKE